MLLMIQIFFLGAESVLVPNPRTVSNWKGRNPEMKTPKMIRPKRRERKHTKYLDYRPNYGAQKIKFPPILQDGSEMDVNGQRILFYGTSAYDVLFDATLQAVAKSEILRDMIKNDGSKNQFIENVIEYKENPCDKYQYEERSLFYISILPNVDINRVNYNCSMNIREVADSLLQSSKVFTIVDESSKESHSGALLVFVSREPMSIGDVASINGKLKLTTLICQNKRNYYALTYSGENWYEIDHFRKNVNKVLYLKKKHNIKVMVYSE